MRSVHPDPRTVREGLRVSAICSHEYHSARVMCLCISPLPIPRAPDQVRQFANPSLTGSSLSLYSNEVFTRFLGRV